MPDTRTARVALAQAAPVFLDAEATLDKAVRLVEEAAAQRADLVAFGEGFLPGHPVWLHVHPVTSSAQIALASALVDAAISIPGPEIEALVEVAGRTGTTVVLGAVERVDPRSSQLALVAVVLTPDGGIASRRKLTPAAGERVLFTPGAGDSIRVFETPLGVTSVLLGGENANPLLTWTARELGARIHLALWPPHFNKPGLMPEIASITARAIAYQNTAHVLSVTGATTAALRERIASSGEPARLLEAMAGDDGSSIYSPGGSLLAGPLRGGEGILYAELDLRDGSWASLVNRHYDRPDLFTVAVRASYGHPALVFEQAESGPLDIPPLRPAPAEEIATPKPPLDAGTRGSDRRPAAPADAVPPEAGTRLADD